MSKPVLSRSPRIIQSVFVLLLLALFACVLFIGSCVLCLSDLTPKAPGGVPVLAAVGLIISIALAIYAVRNMSKKK